MRRAVGWLLLVLVVYTLGVAQGRTWGEDRPEAPASVQTPAPGWDYDRPLCAELASYPDEVVRRRACEK